MLEEGQLLDKDKMREAQLIGDQLYNVKDKSEQETLAKCSILHS
jgi:hypothetical protein